MLFFKSSFFNLILCLALTHLLYACSNTLNIPENSKHFHTRITSANLKHFQVSIILPPVTRYKNPNQANASQYSPEERTARKAEKMLTLLAEEKIAETLFCREGYWFLGENFYGRKVYLRGECNDTATPEDREKFPDTLLYW